MLYIGNIASPSPTLDHQTTLFEAVEYLIINDYNYAFIKNEEEIVGIISSENLLENYKSRELADATVTEYLEPLISINENEPITKAANLMSNNLVEQIAVKNQTGAFVGIACLSQITANV